MAELCACRSLYCNSPLNGKDNFAGAALKLGSTNNNETFTHTSTMSRVFTPALALPPAPANSTARSFEKDVQQIFKTVQEARPPTLVPQPLVFPNKPCEKFLKARFSNVYCGKTHIKCYNFCQQCKDHFTSDKAKGHNWVLFATISF